MDFGFLKEGVIELDPMTGRMVVRCEGSSGYEYFDVQEALEKYKNEEVRVIIVPIATIDTVAGLVESGQMTLEEAPKVR